MKTKSILVAALASVLTAVIHADVLELKNGTVLNGKYAGGTAGTIRFDTSTGQQVIEAGQAIALTFTAPPAAVAPAPAAVPAAVPAAAAATAAAGPVTLPAGTTLLVKMMDSVSSKSAPGANFTTKLEYDLVVGGVKAVPAGTVIYGKVQSAKQAGRAAGKSSLDIRLVQLVLNGSPIPISSSEYEQAGDASIKKAVRGAAAGAAVGAIADGSDGAGEGAAIGATASLLKKGETVTIPPGTLLEFTLTQPLTLPAAK